MKVLVYSTKPYERIAFEFANDAHDHQLCYIDVALTQETASIAEGYQVISCFVHDELTEPVLRSLCDFGVRLIVLRTAGFDNIDLPAANKLGMRVTHVPNYSPHAIAEHAVAMILALNRRLLESGKRTRDNNFSLTGLMGFDLYKKTIGIIGTGRIGCVFAQIMSGFGCELIAYDPVVNEQCKKIGVHYLPLKEVFIQSDVISLHCLLNKDTFYLVDDVAFQLMHPGTMLINTARGAVIDTSALIRALKEGRIASVGLDVYEFEKGLYFREDKVENIDDPYLKYLQNAPNVLLTAHQAFFTKEALSNIIEQTLTNISNYEKVEPLEHELTIIREP